MSNREELTRQAEKCLRQGRVEDAITLYQELADLAPIDWGIVKQLADLFERAGQREAASRQFCRWADHLAVEGFHSKAAALYKKVLKLEPGDEHALWRLGEVSLELKLRADARVAFQRVLELRQRRGDTTGVVVARERLATLDAAAPAPVRSPLTSLPRLTPPAAVPAAPITEATRPAPPADLAPALVPGAEVLAAPPDTPERRLARLRHEAEEADRLQRSDADARWQAVLDADPQDVATRLRLVQRAMDDRNVEAAHRLALPLDASETSALVLLVELAWRRGHPDAIDRLVAGRVHAGASPGHVLAPVDALGVRLPDAARTALSAAVTAWKAAGQPGHAVAALELADRQGLLDLELHLRWVEICVDAGEEGLSRAQGALARAYVAAGRMADARAVAVDLFVREAGAEPYRALLLDVLDRLGEASPHRVLVDLLTPPSEAIDEPPAFSSPVTREVVELDLDLAVTVLPAARADVEGRASTSFPPDGVDEPQAPPRREAAVGEQPLGASPPADTPDSSAPAIVAADLPDVGLAVAATGLDTSATPSFDWAFLLGRDVEERRSVAVACTPAAKDPPLAPAGLVAPATTEDEAGAVAQVCAAPSHADADPDEPVVTPGPVASEVDAADPSPEEPLLAPVPEPPSQSPAAIAEAPVDAVALVAKDPLGAPEHDPYELRTPVDPVLAKIAAAQPLMAASAEVLPPTFAVPSSWFADTPGGQGGAPRQRHPEDAYLFEDDERRPGGWSSPPRFVPPDSMVAIPGFEAAAAPPAGASDPVGLSGSGDHGDTPPLPDSLPAASARAECDAGAGHDPVDAGSRDAASAEPVLDEVNEEVDLTELLEELRQFDTVLPDPPARPAPAERVDGDAEVEAVSGLAATFGAAAMSPPPTDPIVRPSPSPAEERAPMRPLSAVSQDSSTELDAVFADLQRHTDDRLVAEQQLAAGRVFLAAGLVAEAARAFERASHAPRSRFAAAQALAELHRSRGQLPDAVSWYEQAAAAPVPDAAAKRPVLYDLAESLEAIGETDRALGVLLDLLSQVEEYRDARARLARLLRVDAGG